MEANLPAFEAARLRYLAVGGIGLTGVWQDIHTIGQYLGRERRADDLVHTMQRAMQAVTTSVNGRRPRVHWEWSAHPVVAARRSWITELLEMAGAENAYADLDVESVRVTLDEVGIRQPDLIVACWCGVRALPTIERVLKRPGWERLSAFQQWRVAVLSEAYFGRPGPRLVQGLEQLATLLTTLTF